MGFFAGFRDHPQRRWALWVVFFLVWTTLLVVPVPSEVHWPVTITRGRKFFLAKGLHFSAYAFFAILSGWLQPRFRWRLLLLFVLMAHAAGSELVQLHLAYRTGTVEDVVLDQAGIAAGLLLSWKWWTGPEKRIG